jgi:hypothetical protein
LLVVKAGGIGTRTTCEISHSPLNKRLGNLVLYGGRGEKKSTSHKSD